MSTLSQSQTSSKLILNYEWLVNSQLPSIDLLNFIHDQIQNFISKDFNDLTKLTILVNLLSSLLRCSNELNEYIKVQLNQFGRNSLTSDYLLKLLMNKYFFLNTNDSQLIALIGMAVSKNDQFLAEKEENKQTASNLNDPERFNYEENNLKDNLFLLNVRLISMLIKVIILFVVFFKLTNVLLEREK